MGLYTRPDSPFLWWSVTIGGRRFRGCCGTAAREEAQRVLKRQRERLRGEHIDGRKPQITMEAAFTRYALDHAIRLPSAGNIARIGESVIAGLGAATLLSRLSPDAIATYVAQRRSQIADASVNRELTILRAVLRMAALRWGAAVATIDWKRQFLIEPAPRDRILSAAEEGRLFTALRPDFHPLVRFALATGIRFDNVRRLRWSQIDWEGRAIRLRVKSRRPGGETHIVPLTATIAAILSAERGRHPVYVFTYVAQRARSEARRAIERVRGERQPFTRDGWRKAWREALAAAELADFRFHDLRHTTATRLLRATGNLRLVQQLLGHRAIETTLRYAKADVDDVREGLEQLENPGRVTARDAKNRV